MQTGSLINHVLATATPVQPVVGMGATELCWTDRRPYTVTKILSPKRILVVADLYKRIDTNGMSDSQEYEYNQNPDGMPIVLKQMKDGTWRMMAKGSIFKLGFRERHFDFSF